ncbi:MAG TPA: GNAT family protein [Bryobacteraceae bacterium]|jgi:RimJ/RimL family protein N-acetyltransferase|nr:GNAT family protein [Bryobacteraceae bacterium]
MPAQPADWPIPLPPVCLRGRLVSLQPLNERDFAALLAFAETGEIWRYLTSRPSTPDRMLAYLEALLRDYNSGAAMPFVVRREDGEIAGLTRFKSLAREHRKALVGSWYSPAVWGTGCNTEGKLLLLEYGFERLGCVRIEFQVDSRNRRSAIALARMGAVEEGTLRSYIIASDGYRRDSIVFSVLDTEWPDVKRRLQLRLEEQLAKR